MPNPFENNNSVFPDITQAVDEAYDDNVINGKVIDKGKTDEEKLDDVAENDVKDLKVDGSIGLGIDRITEPEIATKFKDAFNQAEKLYKRVGLLAPTAEKFDLAGVDFAELAEKGKNIGEFDVVISPILRVSGYDWPGDTTPSWEDLYRNLTNDSSITSTLYKPKKDSKNCLIFDEAISSNSGIIQQQEEKIISESPDAHTITTLSASGKKLLWIVSIVPTSKEPQSLNEPREEYENPDIPGSSRHLGISQYLSLQAARIQKGEKLLNSNDIYSTFVGSLLKIKDSDGEEGIGSMLALVWRHDYDLNAEKYVRLPNEDVREYVSLTFKDFPNNSYYDNGFGSRIPEIG